jgi:hypothetical protein
MTIESEIYQQINKLSTNLANAYAALENKGATIPANKNFDNLAATIGSLTYNDMANVISAVNYTGVTLAKGAKVWITMKNPNTSLLDGYYIINFNDGVDNSCYSAITDGDCQPLGTVDVFTVLDGTSIIVADNDDYTYEPI